MNERYRLGLLFCEGNTAGGCVLVDYNAGPNYLSRKRKGRAEVDLDERQLEVSESRTWDFSDLKALFLNCTLKRSPELSHTEGLVDISRAIMQENGVSVEALRPVDHDIAYGVWPDMKEHGWERDDWPLIYEKVKEANILVISSPIWLGEKSSVCTKVIERLYSTSTDLNAFGRYSYYGRVAGCLITGNEDGVKHCSMNILYSLQHLGYVIPPQADAGWIGEAGPGPRILILDLEAPRTTSQTETRRS
jgi:multimeric flavodoxin WrbA